jgi:tryptophan 2,3-dioxygenase
MALLPASGFQSAQYRMIEICSTDLINIVSIAKREELKEKSLEEKFEFIYWKEGATEIASGKKTLTLKEFERKYTDQLTGLAKRFESRNMWQKFAELEKKGLVTEDLKNEMRQLDVNVNINWPLVHYKSAVRYLSTDKKEDDTAATGGTNWQKYCLNKKKKSGENHGGRCKKEYCLMHVLKSRCVFIALCFVLQLNVSCDSKPTTASSKETAELLSMKR